MFGLFYTIANLIGISISGTKRAIDNEYYRQEGWKEYNEGRDHGTHTYQDAQGRTRDLTTNHIMSIYRKNDDLYVKDLETQQVRNLSKEKRIKKSEEIKRNNPHIKAVFYKYWTYSNSELRYKSWGIPGTVFRDVHTGELYFERYITMRKSDFSKKGIIGDFDSAYFYLKISDGKIASVSDRQIEKDPNSKDKYKDFIDFFNNEQDKGGFVARNRNEYAKDKEAFYLANEKIYN